MSDLTHFRAQVRGFLRSAMPADLIEAVDAHCVISREQARRMQCVLHEKGWAAPAWPKAHGGPGWSLMEQAIFKEELALSGAPLLENLGIETIGPTLIRHGSPAQCERFLPRMLSFEDYWAQCYSEPGAGSDLAALRTTARLDGEHWIVNGTKIWQSYGHWANWALVLVRTRAAQEGAPRQAGISVLLVDLASPGVTVRPIRLTNGAHFHAEMFFDDVRVPVANVVGRVDEGWSIAKDLLVTERLFTARVPEIRAELQKLRKLAAGRGAQGGSLFECDRFAAQYAQAEMKFRSLEAAWWPALRMAEGEHPPEVEASLLKCQGSELLQEVHQLQVQAVGLDGLPFDPVAVHGGISATPHSPAHGENLPLLVWRFRGATLGGGSLEIQRQIVAKSLFASDDLIERVGCDGRSQEQGMLHDAVRRLLGTHGGFERRRQMIEGGLGSDPACWNGLAELGLTGLLVPEEHGGFGGDATDLLAPMDALGEALSLEPVVWSAVLCTQLYVACEAFAPRAARLGALASGVERAAIGLHSLQRPADVTAALADGVWCLRGDMRLVMGGDEADHFIVAARIGDQDMGLFEVAADSPGVSRRSYRCHDGRRAVDLHLHDLRLPPAALMAREARARAALAATRSIAALALCADSIGAMRRALRLTIEHLRMRHQFGQALAQFQALRHRVADHYRSWFFAQAIVQRTAQGWQASSESERLADLSAAQWFCGRYGRDVGLDAIQLHGAIGMQDETPISHCAQRLVANDTLLGHREQHVDQLIRTHRAAWMADAASGACA